MAVVLHEIVDSDFEYVLKATTTSTNSAASLLDASAANIDEFGSFLIISTDILENEEIPYDAGIISCYPNPFNPYALINYTLENNMDVKFEIYNILGQEIFKSNNIYATKGVNQYRWNGLDNEGNHLTSGVYIVIMKTSDEIFSQKITLLK